MSDQPIAQQEAEVKEVVKGKASFGINQLDNPTPMWVIWIFRIQFVINKALTIWFTTTTLIPNVNIKEVMLTLTIVDFTVWGLGKFVGVSKDNIG